MLCLLVSAGYAQTKEVSITVDITTFPKPDSIYVLYNGLTQTFARPDQSGKYVFRIAPDLDPTVILLMDESKPAPIVLFLEKDDNLLIKIDSGDMPVFGGRGAENNRVNYLLTKTELDFDMHNKQINSQNPADLSGRVTAKWRPILDILERNKQKVTPGFYTYKSVSSKYKELDEMMRIPFTCQALSGKKLSECIPPDYWELQKRVKVDENLLSNFFYRSFMSYSFIKYLRNKEKNRLGMLDSTFSQEANVRLDLRNMDQMYTGKSKSAARRDLLITSLTEAKDIQVYKPLVDMYLDSMNTEDARLVSASYENNKKTALGVVPPYFELKDLNNKVVTLKDFAGKVVYIDFWASWCQPCRGEMKRGNPKLHPKFKDNKDVVFLYISIDDNYADWKDAIAQDKIDGIHLLSKGGMKSAVAKAFNIISIPRYMIIDRDGRIFDNNAPRPSQDITQDKINEALAK
ncbi:Thiol-disulfide oxidoreductase resA [Sphingobacterium spiritivorum]|nr:Thiol-disulfide oxidoreductase resA [Sphingobacterium spiritivorum]